MLQKLSLPNFLKNNSPNTTLDNVALKAFALYGASVLLSKVISTGKSLYNHLLKPGHNLIERYGEKSTALITGGSDGIGLAFAEELIQKGFNIVLMGRNQAHIDTAVAQLKTLNPNATVTAIKADFTQCMEESFFDDIFKQLEGLDISLVVHSVGKFVVDAFNNQKDQEVIDQTVVNVIPHLLITRKLLPTMLAREKKSGIIFISSIAGTYPRRGATVYSATKACLDFVARGLAIEHGEKVDILSLRSYTVTTKMTCGATNNPIIITPKECAQAALKKLGVVPYSYGHWRHQVYGYLFTNTPIRYLLINSLKKSLVEGAEKNKDNYDVSHILRSQ